MKLLEAQEYRSIPKVNMTNNRVRVVLTMTLNEWHIFKKEHKSTDKKGGKCERCPEECSSCCG